MWETIREILFPSKTLKVRLTTLLILVLIITLGFLFARREKIVAGRIVDCETRSPVVGAYVEASQHGWGISGGQLVWDKPYPSGTKSGNSGDFVIHYRVGSAARLGAIKDGYIKALQPEVPRKGVVIGMLRGDKPTEVTYNCKLSSECFQTTVENGMPVSRNICQ